MASFRIFTSYLAFATLLISNVAGWVHVGYHCEKHRQLESGLQAIATFDAVTGDAGSQHSKEQSCRAHNVLRCSCHHHDDHQQLGETGPDSADPKTPPAGDHDSDSCSVCQSFFASRNIVASTDVSIAWTPLPVGLATVGSNGVRVDNALHLGLSVRGPPALNDFRCSRWRKFLSA